MHVEMENIIKKLERYIEDDEVTYEFDDAIEELEQLDLGLSSVESLLGFMEKHPFTDFGMRERLYIIWSSFIGTDMKNC